MTLLRCACSAPLLCESRCRSAGRQASQLGAVFQFGAVAGIGISSAPRRNSRDFFSAAFVVPRYFLESNPTSCRGG